MSSNGHTFVGEIERLRRETNAAAEAFRQQYGSEVEAYRELIADGLKGALARLDEYVREISGGNRVCEELIAHASEYIDWLQWSLWDLPYFAVALRPPAEQFRNAVATCGLVYLSIRIFDDVIDRHFW